MKKLFLFLALPLLFSCGSGIMDIASSGKPYEVFVVTGKDIWKSALGDSIRISFNEEVEWLNQPEPLFDLLNITPAALNDHARKHRNLLFVEINSDVDSCNFVATPDVWATNQQVMTLSGPSQTAIADYWSANGAVFVQWLGLIERDRMASRAAKYNDAGLDKMIFDKFGLKINIPKGYKVSSNKDNFMWLGSDIRLGTLGIVIYDFERGDSSAFDFISRRNYAVAQIPGPSDGSFMTTDTVFTPDATAMEINGVAWIQAKGFWKIERDFMGGPFVGYITYDKARGRYIGVDMFVNSPDPKYPKRNYVRQFEAIIMNAKL